MASGGSTKTLSRRDRCLLQIPPDFLRIQNQPVIRRADGAPAGNSQTALDEQLAYSLHQQWNAGGMVGAGAAAAAAAQSIRGRLLISIMQAKLVKNYGMTRMDPYVRLHVGHNIYETPTDVNGSKQPRWNKTIQCFLPQGIQQVYLEIYDECSFSVDELIAHATLQIPKEIFNGETIEEWYNLSGKQGEGREGQILLVFSFMPTNVPSMTPYFNKLPTGTGAPPAGVVVGPPGQPPAAGGGGAPPATQQQQPTQPPPQFNQSDFDQLTELFPNVDRDAIKSIYEVSKFNKDRAVDAILNTLEE